MFDDRNSGRGQLPLSCRTLAINCREREGSRDALHGGRRSLLGGKGFLGGEPASRGQELALFPEIGIPRMQFLAPVG